MKMKFPGQDLYPGLICKENDTVRVSACMFPYRIFDLGYIRGYGLPSGITSGN